MRNRWHKYLLLIFALNIVLSGSACIRRSPFVMGTWDGDVFTNEWTEITFEMPAGFKALATDAINLPYGQVADFQLLSDDGKTALALYYVDASFEETRDDTAEDYFNTTKEELAASTERDYILQENYEDAVIAGEEYLVMRAEYTDHDNPSEVVFQDAYARRWVDTMVLFLAVYSADTKDIVDSLLASISPLQ